MEDTCGRLSNPLRDRRPRTEGSGLCCGASERSLSVSAVECAYSHRVVSRELWLDVSAELTGSDRLDPFRVILLDPRDRQSLNCPSSFACTRSSPAFTRSLQRGHWKSPFFSTFDLSSPNRPHRYLFQMLMQTSCDGEGRFKSISLLIILGVFQLPCCLDDRDCIPLSHRSCNSPS